MRKEARGMVREDEYLHNVVGLTADRKMCVLIANGRLEHLGREIAKHGAQRAIMVDNGGSSTVFHFPKGFTQPPTQLVAGLNFRPSGTAFLVVVQAA
jgi:hypothetical protein